MIVPHSDRTRPLAASLAEIASRLAQHQDRGSIEGALEVLDRIACQEVDGVDWQLLAGILQDLDQGFRVFYPYRHTRKISIFGSARVASDRPIYRMAVEFARRACEDGFMVITGAGGGIMQAGNEGAGREKSFGLNIELPFEQGANAYIAEDPKLIDFKYFFTRKLFFLRESDAIALFPGGYGTQDEGFECLTLCQTGKYGPVPLVLIDEPGGDYWQAWDEYIRKHLIGDGLVSPEDSSIYTITDDIDVACAAIENFYRIYHSSRCVGDLLVMRLKAELSEERLAWLNDNFSDILLKGKITKSEALPEEAKDGTEDLPRLTFHFNQRDLGRLYQLIRSINRWEECSFTPGHPEWK